MQSKDSPTLSYEITSGTPNASLHRALKISVTVVILLGSVAIATMPCEIFCEIGLEFKSRSPLQPAFMVELAHGYFGYLPTPRQHKLGGYETWLGTNRLEPAASDKLLAILLEMAGQIKQARSQ